MTTDEQSIRNLVAQWHSATAAGDVKNVLSLMAEDVVFLVAGQPPMKGRSMFEKGLRRLLERSQNSVQFADRSVGDRCGSDLRRQAACGQQQGKHRNADDG